MMGSDAVNSTAITVTASYRPVRAPVERMIVRPAGAPMTFATTTDAVSSASRRMARCAHDSSTGSTGRSSAVTSG